MTRYKGRASAKTALRDFSHIDENVVSLGGLGTRPRRHARLSPPAGNCCAHPPRSTRGRARLLHCASGIEGLTVAPAILGSDSVHQAQCPLWVKSRHVRRNNPCLHYPPKRPRKLPRDSIGNRRVAVSKDASYMTCGSSGMPFLR
jgi:hypothetical protein